MKRFMSAALVATLFASTAMAQPPERGDRGERGQRGDGGQRQRPDLSGGPRGDRQQGPRQAQQAPQARPAPQAQAAPQAGPQPGRGSYLRTPGPQGDAARRGDDPRNVAPNRPDNAQRGPDNRGGDNRGNDNRGNDNRGPGNRPGFDNRGQDNRFDNRGQPNRGFDNRRPGQQQYRGPNQQQLRDRDRGRQWFDQRSFRPSYRAPQRFRVAPYRAPPGFYSRSWSFGDRLPYGWFGSGYYLNWGSYGLPFPPIGAEWVRVGSDALLVDIWSGEVLSVYYGLFW
jgi:Ni/Co efflux regulator RcnB